MSDTERQNTYEITCQRCIADLYRAAYLTLSDSALAQDVVKQTCVACVHRYGKSEDPIEIRYNLVQDLTRRCRRKLQSYTPSTDALPEAVRSLTSDARLKWVARVVFGMAV